MYLSLFNERSFRTFVYLYIFLEQNKKSILTSYQILISDYAKEYFFSDFLLLSSHIKKYRHMFETTYLIT